MEAGGNGDPGWADDETQALEPQPPPLNAMLVLPSLGPFWREKGWGKTLDDQGRISTIRAIRLADRNEIRLEENKIKLYCAFVFAA